MLKYSLKGLAVEEWSRSTVAEWRMPEGLMRPLKRAGSQDKKVRGLPDSWRSPYAGLPASLSLSQYSGRLRTTIVSPPLSSL
jgi:hypothetical protein